MFYKSMPFEVKADANNRTFEGYASKFGNVDLHNDIIERGAFAKTIQERLPKNMIKVFWQHMEPIGMPELLKEDDDGLYVRGRISNTRLGDEAIELMRDSVVDGMSIGYDVVKDEEDDKGVRRLKELKLYEVSVVTWGANPEAMITNVKHLHALNTFFKNDSALSLEEMKKQLEILNDLLSGDVFGAKNGNLTLNVNEFKAGRVLSKKNRGNLEDAINLIQTVLDTADESESPKGTKPKNRKQVEPEDGEAEDEFLNRCMLAETDIEDEDERMEFCQLQWNANQNDEEEDIDDEDDNIQTNGFESESFKSLFADIKKFSSRK